ncbi:unnamed protein product, partial [Durusdinium trenchii]
PSTQEGGDPAGAGSMALQDLPRPPMGPFVGEEGGLSSGQRQEAAEYLEGWADYDRAAVEALRLAAFNPGGRDGTPGGPGRAGQRLIGPAEGGSGVRLGCPVGGCWAQASRA